METNSVLDYLLSDYQSRCENVDPSFNRDVYKELMLDEMDRDGSGFISVHEMKVFLTKKFVELNKEPAETA